MSKNCKYVECLLPHCDNSSIGQRENPFGKVYAHTVIANVLDCANIPCGTQGSKGERGPRGHSGQTGWQGLIGIDGKKGKRGYMGYQGHAGCVGSCGSEGPRGHRGDQGYKGDIGVQGYYGPQGVSMPGFEGKQGVQGCQGPNSIGAQGETGSQGQAGGLGLQGNNGSQGNNGVQGICGVQGNHGTTIVIQDTAPLTLLENETIIVLDKTTGNFWKRSDKATIQWDLILQREQKFDKVCLSDDGSMIFATCASNAQVYKSSNGGQQFQKSLQKPCNVITCSSSGQIVMACTSTINQGIYVSTNKGDTFSQSGDIAHIWTCLCLSNDGEVAFAGGDDIPVHRSLNKGFTWQSTNSIIRAWTHLACSARGNIVLASTTVEIFISLNLGQTFVQTGSTFPLIANIALSETNIYVLCVDGAMYVSDYSGISFTLFAENILDFVTAKDGRRILMMFKNSNISQYSIDGGTSFVNYQHVPGSVITNNSFYLSNNGVYCLALTNGNTWLQKGSPTPGNIVVFNSLANDVRTTSKKLTGLVPIFNDGSRLKPTDDILQGFGKLLAKESFPMGITYVSQVEHQFEFRAVYNVFTYIGQSDENKLPLFVLAANESAREFEFNVRSGRTKYTGATMKTFVVCVTFSIRIAFGYLDLLFSINGSNVSCLLTAQTWWQQGCIKQTMTVLPHQELQLGYMNSTNANAQFTVHLIHIKTVRTGQKKENKKKVYITFFCCVLQKPDIKMQTLMSTVLETGELIQINGADDSYYLGSCEQLVQLCNTLFEYKPCFDKKFAWVSDSDLCIRRFPLISMDLQKEAIDAFHRAVNPTVRGVFVIDASTGNIKKKLFDYCVRDWDYILEDETLLMGSASALMSAQDKYDCVINCTTNIGRLGNITDENYLQLAWLDDINQQIVHGIVEAVASIHKWRLKGKRVLVHCEEGISRSAACVLGYLLQSHSLTEAQYILGQKRPIAKANLGFMKQLQQMSVTAK